jgi:hypothetical protein
LRRLPGSGNAWLRPRFDGFEEFQIQALTMLARFLKREKSCRETLRQFDELYATEEKQTTVDSEYPGKARK